MRLNFTHTGSSWYKRRIHCPNGQVNLSRNLRLVRWPKQCSKSVVYGHSFRSLDSKIGWILSDAWNKRRLWSLVMNQKSNIWFELTHFKSSVTHYLAKYWVTLDLKWVIRGRRGTLVVVALAWESTAFRPSNRKIFRAALQYTAPPCPVRTHSALQRACWPYLMTAACNAKLEAFFLSMLRARISHRSENCNGDSWRFVAIRGCLVRGGTSDANRHERCRTAIGT